MDPISARIDDRDPRVRFIGNWRIGGVKQDFNKTESSSTRAGDSFIVPFYGQSIVVYGTIDASSGGVVTNYTIDGMPPAQMTSQRGPKDIGKQQFWASPALNVSQHELTVTMVKVNNDPEDGEGTIWFDYFTVYDPSGHERMPPPSNKALPKGAIVGAIMGGVICLILLFLGAFFWIRKRRLRLKDETRPHRYYLERDKDLRDYPQEKRGDMEASLGALEAKSRLSRIGIQPFTLEPSVPLNSPQVPPAFRKSRVLEETGPERDHDNNLQSQPSSSRLNQNIVVGTSKISNAQDPPSTSLKLRLTHKSILSPGAGSLHPTNALASPSRNTADETVVDLGATLSNPTSAADTNHGGSSDQTSINCAQSSSAITSDPRTSIDAERTTPSPGVEVTLGHSINSAAHPDQTEEREQRSRSTIQHVDSGIRLGTEALCPPIELPPVYSAI